MVASRAGEQLAAPRVSARSRSGTSILTTHEVAGGRTRLAAASPDRAYIVARPAMWTNMTSQVVAGRLGEALEAQAAGDHVWVRTSLHVRDCIPPRMQPLPRWVVQSEVYGKTVDRMSVERRVADCGLVKGWRRHT